MDKPPPRLVDLHCDWLLQYAGETTLFDPSCYAEIPGRVRRLDGYLLGARAAVLACSKAGPDWARAADPWSALGALVARYEAEFAGRLLIGPEDVARFGAEPPDALCWGVLGVTGLDYLVREPADLDRMAALLERGVRVFQLVESRSGCLAGTAAEGDERSLTELGRAVLNLLAERAPAAQAGPAPVVDLAGMNDRSIGEVLDWLEAGAGRTAPLLPIVSHGAVTGPVRGDGRGISQANLARLRAIGGVMGLTAGIPYYQSPEELRAGIEAIASVPFLGRQGFEGIALGTDFLALASTLPGLGELSGLSSWLFGAFDRETAYAVAAGNALRLLLG